MPVLKYLQEYFILSFMFHTKNAKYINICHNHKYILQ